MKKIFILICLAACVVACRHKDAVEGHDHDHGGITMDITAYSDDYEVYADVTPLAVGHESEWTLYVTRLEDFSPLTQVSLHVEMTVGGKRAGGEAVQTESAGIFHLHITPPAAGEAAVEFTLATADSTVHLMAERVPVFEDEHEAMHEADEMIDAHPMAVTFTKVQSWQTDFATALPEVKPMGQVIPVVAQVQSAPGDEMTVVAKAGGILRYVSGNLLEGSEVRKGTILAHILSDGLLDENLSVRLSAAKNDYEMAKQNYERAQSLVESRIVSQKEFLEYKNIFEKAKAEYENLQSGLSGGGVSVQVPMNGFVRGIYASNGDYVSVGQPVLQIVQNRDLVLRAEVPQRYAAMLPRVADACVENPVSREALALSDLGGRVLSYGKSVSPDNFMLPVTLAMKGSSDFPSGSFVNVWLKTAGGAPAVVVPKSALVEDQGQFFVFVQITPEKFEKQPVVVGVTDGKEVEILSGLDATQRIVTRGAVMVKLSKNTGTLDPHAGHVH